MNPLDALKSWLQDNIDMDSELCFDGDGKVKSEHVLAAFDSLLGMFVVGEDGMAHTGHLFIALALDEDLARQPRGDSVKRISDNLEFSINDFLDKKYAAPKTKRELRVSHKTGNFKP